MIDGILLVDKPEGATSADVVRAVSRRHGLSGVGHLGTLDPMATGLLPLCLGSATKLARFLSGERKAYSGRIRLGIATDTLDVTGREIGRADVPAIDAHRLAEVATRLSGAQEQVPPMYSAVKVKGKELYKHARAGKTVERSPRSVFIEYFELTPSSSGDPEVVDFAVRCSKGTYVRVLAEDVGRELGTLAALAALRRTGFGAYELRESVPLDRILDCAKAELPLLSPRQALRGVREMAVDESVAFGIATGRRDVLRRLPPPEQGDGIGAVIDPHGDLLAVVAAGSDGWELKRVVLAEAARLYRPVTEC